MEARAWTPRASQAWPACQGRWHARLTAFALACAAGLCCQWPAHGLPALAQPAAAHGPGQPLLLCLCEPTQPVGVGAGGWATRAVRGVFVGRESSKPRVCCPRVLGCGPRDGEVRARPCALVVCAQVLSDGAFVGHYIAENKRRLKRSYATLAGGSSGRAGPWAIPACAQAPKHLSHLSQLTPRRRGPQVPWLPPASPLRLQTAPCSSGWTCGSGWPAAAGKLRTSCGSASRMSTCCC